MRYKRITLYLLCQGSYCLQHNGRFVRFNSEPHELEYKAALAIDSFDTLTMEEAMQMTNYKYITIENSPSIDLSGTSLLSDARQIYNKVVSIDANEVIYAAPSGKTIAEYIPHFIQLYTDYYAAQNKTIYGRIDEDTDEGIQIIGTNSIQR